MEFRETHRAGAVKQITSHSNPIVKEIKGLVAQRKNRKQSGLFVAEGLKLATDALEAGWGVRYLALGPEARENKIALEAAAKAKARGALILEVNNAVLGAITRRDNPQMVVGVYEQQTLKLSDIDPHSATTWIALDRVRDPGNLGTIIRTGDAVGATGVILIDDTTDRLRLRPCGRRWARCSICRWCVALLMSLLSSARAGRACGRHLFAG